jgi:hypothetical protein
MSNQKKIKTKKSDDGTGDLSEVTPPSHKINHTNSFPFSDPEVNKISEKIFSMSEAISPIPLIETTLHEEQKNISSNLEPKLQVVSSCRDQVDGGLMHEDKVDYMSEGALRQTTPIDGIIHASLDPMATDGDAKQSITSDEWPSLQHQKPEAVENMFFENMFLKPKMMTMRLEELYVKELKSIADNYDLVTNAKKQGERSIKPTYSQKRFMPAKTKTDGATSSAKKLKEYILWREAAKGKGELSSFQNIFGDTAELIDKSKSIVDRIAKHKSASPNFISKSPTSSPKEHDDDTLRQHFGEMSLLNELTDDDPSARRSETKRDVDHLIFAGQKNGAYKESAEKIKGAWTTCSNISYDG